MGQAPTRKGPWAVGTSGPPAHGARLSAPTAGPANPLPERTGGPSAHSPPRRPVQGHGRPGGLRLTTSRPQQAAGTLTGTQTRLQPRPGKTLGTRAPAGRTCFLLLLTRRPELNPMLPSKGPRTPGKQTKGADQHPELAAEVCARARGSTERSAGEALSAERILVERATPRVPTAHGTQHTRIRDSFWRPQVVRP